MSKDSFINQPSMLQLEREIIELGNRILKIEFR